VVSVALAVKTTGEPKADTHGFEPVVVRPLVGSERPDHLRLPSVS
jgi:hypothetical protein